MATVQTAPSADEVTWGDRLRRLRLNRGMDQRHFAAAIGVAKPTIGAYELARILPRNHRLVENSVELRFGQDAADFLRGAPSNPQLTDYRIRQTRRQRGMGGLPDGTPPARSVTRPRVLRSA